MSDVKPENVFLVQPPGGPDPGRELGQVKLIDFGLSKLCSIGDNSRGSQGLFLGTPSYMPPEAWRSGSGALDARADQWSLAALAFRLLTGQLPFPAGCAHLRQLRQQIESSPTPSLRALVPDLAEHVHVAINRALSKNRDERFPTVRDFVSALQRLPRDADLSLPVPRRAIPDDARAAGVTAIAPSASAAAAPPAVRKADPGLVVRVGDPRKKARPQTFLAGSVLGFLASLLIGSGIYALGVFSQRRPPPPALPSGGAASHVSVGLTVLPRHNLPVANPVNDPADAPEPPPAPLLTAPPNPTARESAEPPGAAPERRRRRKSRLPTTPPPSIPAKLPLPE